MDPDEALRLLREDMAEIRALTEGARAASPFSRAVEHFEALDGWLSNGGFPPEPWTWGAKN